MITIVVLLYLIHHQAFVNIVASLIPLFIILVLTALVERVVYISTICGWENLEPPFFFKPTSPQTHSEN
jgi:hypothetical protein